MPYDSNLDRCVFSKAYKTDSQQLTVGVYSYNNGPKKLQITRANADPEGNVRFAKLGRMTKEEIEAIFPLIQEALGKMD